MLSLVLAATLAVGFAGSILEAKSPSGLDGRLLVLLSIDFGGEPRFQINDGPNTQIALGVDLRR